MKIKRLFFICSLTAFIAGCSDFFATQPPAPVYGGAPIVSQKPAPALPKPVPPKEQAPQQINQGSNEVVKIQPLPEFVPKTTPLEDVRPEPIVTEPYQEEKETLGHEQEEPLPSEQEPSQTEQKPAETSPAEQQAVVAPEPERAPPPPPPPPPLPKFEPLETFAPLSPAVGALASAANHSSQSGNVDSATSTIERAIRIEPRNATLYYKLALLRLKQSKPRMAEDLAKKAALLASNDPQLKKHSWILVARAREIQGDIKGGKEARVKADKIKD
jgi:hypothetical protein